MASATACDCPSTDRQVVRGRSCGAPCTRRAAAPVLAASRTPSAPCLATKSAGSRPSGMIITTAWTEGNRSWNANARSAARAPASSESNARIGALRRTAQSWRKCPSPSAVPQVATAFSMPGLRPARSRRCSPRPRRPRPSRAIGRARAMQVVEHLVLAVDRRLGGVEVLGLLARPLIARQDARAEPDAAALQVVDREGQPAAEPVADRGRRRRGWRAPPRAGSRGSGRAPGSAAAAGSRR